MSEQVLKQHTNQSSGKVIYTAKAHTTGGREGGACTAASFLGKFAKDLAWAHLDVAGTAWLSGAQKGSTGRPVPLLVDFLIHRAKAS